MAEKKKADKKADKGADKAPGSRIKLIILIVILVLLLAGAGGAAYYFLWYGKSAGDTDASETPAEVVDETASAAHGAADATAMAFAPLTYHKLDSFTVNLPPGPMRFLRISLTIATPNPAVIAAVDKHMPMLRNDILTLLATQQFAALNTAEGKDTLRESLRQTLVRLLVRASEPSDIRDVLFNELIMQ